MEEWKEYKLGEIFDFNNGLSKGGKFFGHGYDFVSFKTVFKNHFLPNTLDDLVESSKKEREKFSVKEGDVFLTRTSETQNELAYSCVALKDYPNATYNGFTKRLRPNGKIKIDSIFSAYFFRSAIFRNQVTSMSNMVTRASLSNEMLDRMSIKIPSYDLQKTIGKILFSFDAKIQLNKRINDNLEQQAQALFKAWFVDFEPFKDGEFVDDNFVRRPYGWNVKPLEYLVEKVKSGDWGKDEQMGNYTMRTFCMRGADFPDIKEGSKGKMPIRYILEKNFKEKSLCDGNVVVEISGGSPTQSTGRIVLIDKTFIADCDNALICTNFCKSLEIKESFSLFFYLLWQYLYNKKVMFIYENGSNGLKNLNINSLLERELFVIPPKEIISRFNLAVSLLLSKKQTNGIEISRLSSLRDTLLPKLMSGNMSFDN
ncbi:restriction endonuclease subunit S [Bacteroides acidifaciens]|uniref:Restriction endonuclease subunit S n=8 Tax=Bacteroides acidifaciens TaxID=85831 RepID=A0A8H0D2E8_9BACE|nr:restriction endonuclease subunit S [Bacteroides acidifaciens]MBF0729497.1 restriction endonuclease subunit S [Bacteroides acidifaciens]MBF0835076.1 restriction endonuclease subunit S [Bacteroides acidifaciens]TFU50005.1 restriction endonuclease subunit S [Bacteroides acidifaciens]